MVRPPSRSTSTPPTAPAKISGTVEANAADPGGEWTAGALQYVERHGHDGHRVADRRCVLRDDHQHQRSHAPNITFPGERRFRLSNGPRDGDVAAI